MKCPECGTEVAPGDVFCGNCGSMVLPEESAAPRHHSFLPPRPRPIEAARR
ncbi:MAG: hypothetical protein DRI77_13380 [Chloroflexi bacterium]|nr:MAG: hypothetical protein DRI77_13380 [Chloroflexota bacterium]